MRMRTTLTSNLYHSKYGLIHKLSIYSQTHKQKRQSCNIQPSRKYFSVRMRITFILWFVYTRIPDQRQQWNIFSLLISIHEILDTCESTILKFNYFDSFVLTTTLIYKYRMQWVRAQRLHRTHTIRNFSKNYNFSC